MKALVIGATGATGKDIVQQLLADDSFDQVDIFVRRDAELSHPKLHVHIVNFEALETWKDLLQGDVLFSAMGTTLKQAGGQKAQWRVDYDYQHEVARAARHNGVPALALVSSVGADSKSFIFYSRMKGALEDAVQALSFPRLIIVRPPSLIREGSDRFGERITVSFQLWLNRIGLLRSMAPTPTADVAAAMIQCAKAQTLGTQILTAKDIRAKASRA